MRFTDRLRIDEGIITGVSAPSRYSTPNEIEPCEMHVEERRVAFDIEIDDRGAFPENEGA